MDVGVNEYPTSISTMMKINIRFMFMIFLPQTFTRYDLTVFAPRIAKSIPD
jgi:hypothetical protein